MLARMCRKGNTSWMGMYVSLASMENNMEIWEKLKNRNIIWFSDSTFGYISKWNKRSLKSYTMQSQPVRERQISYDITYMWNLKYDTDEFIYKAETDSQT